MRYKQSRLFRRKHNFYIRVSIPEKLKKLVKKSEIRYSLGTSNYHLALQRCREESYKIDLWFKELVMKARQDNSLELNQNDLDTLQVSRIQEIEKQRKIYLKMYNQTPENEFGLFSNENFKQWIEDDPEPPERKARLIPRIIETPDGIEEEPALSVDSDEFKRDMVVKWFKNYLRTLLDTDKSLKEDVKNVINGVLDGTLELRIIFKTGTDGGALLKLQSILYPLEKYANEKAIAEYNHTPYQPDDEITTLLKALELQRINQLATSKIGKKTEKTHWRKVWNTIKQNLENEHQNRTEIQSKEYRLNKLFNLIGKEYLEDITTDDCDKLNIQIYHQNWGRGGKSTTNRTIESYLSIFKKIFREARKRDSDILDVRDLIKLPTSDMIEETQKSRGYFTEDKLDKIFNNQTFIHYRYDMEFYPRFWVPLMCLYSACRQNEICQLEVDNIKTIEGIPCMVITDTGYKQKLKNKQSKRVVPIHSKLIQLGLLELVKKVKKSSSYRKKWIAKDSQKPKHTPNGKLYYPDHNPNGLFFTLTYTEHNGFADKITKWFNPLLVKLGIKEIKNNIDGAIETLVFHCFRHSTSSNLSSKEVSDTWIDKICGWKVKGTRGRYIHSDGIAAKKMIEKITYPSFEKNVLPKLMPNPEKEKDFFNFKE